MAAIYSSSVWGFLIQLHNVSCSFTSCYVIHDGLNLISSFLTVIRIKFQYMT